MSIFGIFSSLEGRGGGGEGHSDGTVWYRALQVRAVGLTDVQKSEGQSGCVSAISCVSHLLKARMLGSQSDSSQTAYHVPK